MALLKRINPFSHSTADTGFGVNASNYGGRFINKDGTYNIRKRGLPFWERYSLYTTMLNMPSWKFLSIIVLFYIFINLVFASVFYFIGIENLAGLTASTSPLKNFTEAFFFSAQTFTTVGYGRISPVGFLTDFVAAIESLIGLLSLAIATGLFYGRFTRPKANILFSYNALISPFQDKTALMFRLVPYKEENHLTDAEVRVTLGLTVEENGDHVFKFYVLPLERNRIDSLSMNWTVVHPIDEKSPILGFNQKDLEAAEAELYVSFRAFNNIYSNTVQQGTSYFYNEIIYGAKFLPMYHESDDKMTTILDLDKLDKYHAAPLPA